MKENYKSEQHRSISAIFFCFILIVCSLALSVQSENTDLEPNDSFDTAQEIFSGTVNGSLNETDTQDFYKLKLRAGDSLSATFSSGAGDVQNLTFLSPAKAGIFNLSSSGNMAVSNSHQIAAGTSENYWFIKVFAPANTSYGNYTFTVDISNDHIDLAPPEINHGSRVSATIADVMYIITTVTDDQAVSGVFLNYTDVYGNQFNNSMTKNGDDYSYNIPPQGTPGVLSYIIWANDTGNNVAMEGPFQVAIYDENALDIKSPVIELQAPASAIAGDPIEITARVTDDTVVANVHLVYSDVTGTSNNVSMTQNGNDYSYTIPLQSAPGYIDLYIWANDSSNNQARSPDSQVPVLGFQKDTEAPKILLDPISTVFSGDPVVISAYVTDNINIVEVILYYRIAKKGDYFQVVMTKSDENYTAEIPSDNVTLEGLEYYILASDGLNSATFPADLNSPLAINVEEKKVEELDNTVIWILIGLLVFCILIFLIMVIKKM